MRPVSLESGRLYRIPNGAYVIKATIAKEALSMYSYTEKPVFIYSNGFHASIEVKDILKRLRQDSKVGHPPTARKVA